MSTKPEAHEYHGQQVRQPSTPLDEPDLSAAVRVAQCASGHTWPPQGNGPCERCGKPSSIPGTAQCRHGVPNDGTFGEHDCLYADMRDSLIPYAEALATGEVKSLRARPGVTQSEMAAEVYAQAWSAAFAKHMDNLTYLAVHGRLR